MIDTKALYDEIFKEGERSYEYIARTFKKRLQDYFTKKPSKEMLLSILTQLEELADSGIKKKVLVNINNVMRTGIGIEDPLDGEYMELSWGEIIFLIYEGEVESTFSEKVKQACLESIESVEKKMEIEVCRGDLITSIFTPYIVKVREIQKTYVGVKTITGSEFAIPFYAISKVIEGPEKERYLSNEMLLEGLREEFEEKEKKFNAICEEKLKSTLIKLGEK